MWCSGDEPVTERSTPRIITRSERINFASPIWSAGTSRSGSSRGSESEVGPDPEAAARLVIDEKALAGRADELVPLHDLQISQEAGESHCEPRVRTEPHRRRETTWGDDAAEDGVRLRIIARVPPRVTQTRANGCEGRGEAEAPNERGGATFIVQVQLLHLLPGYDAHQNRRIHPGRDGVGVHAVDGGCAAR